jgi:hypothetical protein
MQESKTGVRVAIIMGSKSDLATMENAATPLTELGVEFELKNRLLRTAHRRAFSNSPPPRTSAASTSSSPERGALRTSQAWRLR